MSARLSAGGRTVLPSMGAIGAPPRSLQEVVLSAAPAAALLASASGVLAGAASLSLNSLDPYRLAILGSMAATLFLLAAHVRYEDGVWSGEIGVLIGCCAVGAALLAVIPEWTYGYYINGIVHRSIFTALLLLFVGSWSTSTALYYVLGGTPTARDRSRFLFVALPITFTFLAYGLVLFRVVEKGAPDLSWHILTHAYNAQLTSSALVRSAGMRNHIEGTFLLMFLTATIALPVGVGTGVYLSEYGGRTAHVVGMCVSMLRSLSVFILGVTAFSLVRYSASHASGTALSDVVQGYYTGAGGFKQAANGSFITASVFLSLLVIPVIARATEEGCRSVPTDLRDGSKALGATDGHALLRILLPWSLPNIVTGLLLGLAEAAGSVTVLLFIAGTGQNGVGPFREVTSLAVLIFKAHPGKGPKSFTDFMSQYEFSAAFLLLIITLALTVGALVLKQRFAKRYRAGISYS
jgi:ABC-type phosphate transport system permease subunit